MLREIIYVYPNIKSRKFDLKHVLESTYEDHKFIATQLARDEINVLEPCV